jgi:hypothetical protein
MLRRGEIHLYPEDRDVSFLLNVDAVLSVSVTAVLARMPSAEDVFNVSVLSLQGCQVLKMF